MSQTDITAHPSTPRFLSRPHPNPFVVATDSLTSFPQVVNFGYLCRSPPSTPAFGINVGDIAVLCTGTIESSKGEGSEGDPSDVIVRIAPQLDDETATAPRRVRVKEVNGIVPFATCEVEGMEDEDRGIEWDDEEYITGMLDLMVGEALAEGVEEVRGRRSEGRVGEGTAKA